MINCRPFLHFYSSHREAKTVVYRNTNSINRQTSLTHQENYNLELKDRILQKINESPEKRALFFRIVNIFQANFNNSRFNTELNNDNQIENLLKKVFVLDDNDLTYLKQFCIHKKGDFFDFFYTRSTYELLKDLNYSFIDLYNVVNLFTWSHATTSLPFAHLRFSHTDNSSFPLENLSFKFFDLTNSQFHNVNLLDSNFERSNLKKTTFFQCQLIAVNFAFANIEQAQFKSSVINVSNFTHSIFKNSIFNSTQFSATPINIGRFNESMSFKNCTFNSMILDDLILKNKNMSGVVFEGVDMWGAYFENVDFTHAIFKHPFGLRIQI